MGEGIQFNHIWTFSHLCLEFKTNGKNGNSSCQEWCDKKRTKKMFYMIFFHSYSLDLSVYGFKPSSYSCSGVISISIIII